MAHGLCDATHSTVGSFLRDAEQVQAVHVECQAFAVGVEKSTKGAKTCFHRTLASRG